MPSVFVVARIDCHASVFLRTNHEGCSCRVASRVQRWCCSGAWGRLPQRLTSRSVLPYGSQDWPSPLPLMLSARSARRKVRDARSHRLLGNATRVAAMGSVPARVRSVYAVGGDAGNAGASLQQRGYLERMAKFASERRRVRVCCFSVGTLASASIQARSFAMRNFAACASSRLDSRQRGIGLVCTPARMGRRANSKE
jgi:hypothetical protein